MSQALLVMEVQRGQFHPSSRPFEAVVKRINSLADRARGAGVTTVVASGAIGFRE